MARIFGIFFCFLFGAPYMAFSQPDQRKAPQITVENNREAVLFLITWSNQKSSTVKFPPFHQIVGKDLMRKWENMVIREIQSNFDAFEAPFSYDVSIQFPGTSENREPDNNLEKIQGGIQDILAMTGGEADLKEDGQICISSIMDWTSVGFELDDFDVAPANRGKTTVEKNIIDGTSKETTNFDDGGTKVVYKDANGVPTLEIYDSATTTSKNSDGSFTTKKTESIFSYDKDGKKSTGHKTTEESTIGPIGAWKKKKNSSEFLHEDGSKTKIENENWVDSDTGEESNFTGVVEKDSGGGITKIAWTWDNVDGSTDKITVNPKTGETKYKHITADEKLQSHEPENEEEPDHTPPENTKSGVEMTTDELTADTNLAFCFPAEMFNLLINWNRLGAAVTDPSPIEDEELFEAGQSTAPIDPPKDEVNWTPSVRYLNILPGDGITDPPRTRD